MVSNSPDRAIKWHNFDNFLPSFFDDIGTRECHLYRNKIFHRHPYLANALANQYIRIYQEKNLREANLFIGRLDKELIIHDLNLSQSPTEIKKFCTDIAHKCRLLVLEYGENEMAYNICQGIAKKYKIAIDALSHDTKITPILNKLSCSKWWFKQINTLRIRHIEQVSRKLNLVHKYNSCYSSNFAVENRKTQLKNSLNYLAGNSIINENGDQFTLLDIYKKSVSNPKIRKAELMTRIRGFEEVAIQMGHAGEFYTLTAPSKMHAVLSSGKPNPKYNNLTPRQVQQYFNDNWKLIRSALHKKNITPYGFRVVEPHHDGTPHWHLLLFMHPEDVKTTRSIFQQYALQEDGNEAGAQKHRFKAISIDPNKGSASGYIAKYISKNIDGSNIKDDLYGNDANIAASSIDAWSATWNIRQFQQIGGPSVTVWRELRRLKMNNHPELKPAFTAADSGDWAAFVMAMGGAMLPRRNRPIHPYYEIKPNKVVDTETGEITISNLTSYGDIKAPSIIGVVCRNIVKKTRLLSWEKIMSPTTAYSPKNEGGMMELAKLHPLPT